MFSLRRWLKYTLNPPEYIWIKAILLKETRKAILIEFDGKQIWLPKVWILRIKRIQCNPTISIKISQYHWAKKLG